MRIYHEDVKYAKKIPTPGWKPEGVKPLQKAFLAPQSFPYRRMIFAAYFRNVPAATMNGTAFF